MSPSSRSSPPRSLLVTGVVAVLVAGGVLLALWRLGGGPDPNTPARLAEAVDPRLPEVLPPLVPEVLSATDLLRDEGGWWLLDGQQRRVVRLDDDFQPLFHFGARGVAPGEMVSPSALARYADTLVVLDGSDGPVLHLFGPDGSFHRLERLVVRECNHLMGTGLVSRTERTPLLLADCSLGDARRTVARSVVELDASWQARILRGEFRRDLPILGAAVATLAPDGDLIHGTIYEACLHRLPATDAPELSGPAGDGAPICLHDWTGVRVDWREALARPDRPVPPDLGLPDWLPVMDRIFPHPDGVILRRLEGTDTRSMVLLGGDGSATTLATRLPEASWVVGDELVVAWTGVEGMHLERRPLPAAGAGAAASAGGPGGGG
jgi:hypothetical protein